MKFEEENIFTLIDPTFLQIYKEMAKLKYLAKNQAETHETNVFILYSGHSRIIEDQLHIVLPTKVTEEEYVSKSMTIAELAVKKADFVQNLSRFNENLKIMGNDVHDNFEILEACQKSSKVQNTYQNSFDKFLKIVDEIFDDMNKEDSF